MKENIEINEKSFEVPKITVALEMPIELKEKIRTEAFHRGLSLSATIRFILYEHYAKLNDIKEEIK